MAHTFTIYPSTRMARLYQLRGIQSVAEIENETPWYAHWRVEFFSTWQGSFLIVVNVRTLLAGILPNPSNRDLETQLARKIRSTMASGGLVTGPNPERPFQYRKHTDRALIGSINDMIRLTGSEEPRTQTDPDWIAGTEKLINRTTFRYLKNERPGDFFTRALTAGDART